MKTVICIPCMDHMDTDFVRSLTSLAPCGETSILIKQGSLVYVSRDKLLVEALAADPDYILWLDSDMVFLPTLLRDLTRDAMEGDLDMVCGLFCRRHDPYTPVLYKTIRMGLPGQAVTEEFQNIPADSVFEIDACGFGAVLMSARMARAVIDEFHTGFIPIPGYGEDISFCIRAKNLGYKLYCDSRIHVGHIARNIITPEVYARLREAGGAAHGGDKYPAGDACQNQN